MSGSPRAAWLAALLAFAATAVLGACEATPPPAVATAPAPPSEFEEPLPPPILQPDPDSAEPEPPSYEVSIATAAAARNDAKKKCAELPDTERKACEAQADADFSASQQELSDLRGN